MQRAMTNISNSIFVILSPGSTTSIVHFSNGIVLIGIVGHGEERQTAGREAE